MFYRKDKIHVEFSYHELYEPPLPEPSSKFLPEWYKNLPKNQVHPQIGLNIDGTAKKCVPILDALSQGYIIPFPCDIMVFHEELFECRVRGGEHLGADKIAAEVEDLERHFGSHLEKRSLGVGLCFKTENFHDKHGGFNLTKHGDWQVGKYKRKYTDKGVWKFLNPFAIKTSPGTSCRFTTPVNRDDLPFSLFEGVVDTDKFEAPVNFPFEWKLGPTKEPTILEAGTPMVQCIPFKRVELTHECNPITENKWTQLISTMLTHIENTYRRKYWHKAKKNK